jgi:xylulokinase
MDQNKLLLGLDISTTGAKALLIDPAGNVVSSASNSLTLSTPRPLWSEQNPADWWAGMAASIREALAGAGRSGEDVVAIGLTGQMHGLVLLDETGEVLRPAILWNDQRERRADRIHCAEGAVGRGERAGRLCEGPAHPAA